MMNMMRGAGRCLEAVDGHGHTVDESLLLEAAEVERVVQVAKPPIKLKRLNWKPRNRGVERRRGKDRERPVVPPGKVRAAGFRWPKKEQLPKLVSRQARTGKRSVRERLG